MVEPLHFSDLKRMALSPAHYLAGLGNDHDKPAMRFGRLVHTLVLGGPAVAVYEGERRGNAWKAFRAENEGREIVTRSELDEATNVARAVLSSEVARPYLIGERERPVEWTTNGRRCATRGIDVLGSTFLADLKTTNCAEPGRFSRACLRMAYHGQLAWYQDAAASIGRHVDEAFIIGVETAPPYAVTVLRVTPRTLHEGRKLSRLWLERLLACEAANEWPGYVQSVVDLDVAEDDVGLIIDGEEIAA